MLGLPGAELVGVDRLRERAAGAEVGDQDGLVGTEHRGRLGHEVDAAELDHVGVGLRRLAGEAERVADEVGHVLELGQLVVVREDDGVPLGRERADLVAQRRDLLLAQLGGKLVDGRKLKHGEPLLVCGCSPPRSVNETSRWANELTKD